MKHGCSSKLVEIVVLCTTFLHCFQAAYLPNGIYSRLWLWNVVATFVVLWVEIHGKSLLRHVCPSIRSSSKTFSLKILVETALSAVLLDDRNGKSMFTH